MIERSEHMATRFNFGTRGNSEPSRQVYETSRQNGSPSTQGIGAVLRERREALGATLAETEAATRIRQKYLAALESDEWHLLPGEVVGRGFLRNYAGYLGLEPTEIIERRRTVANESVAPMLVNTSAGSALPPVRQVDYRPKDVDLRDEPDVMETRELRLAPWLGALGVILLAALLWWGRDSVATQAGNVAGFTQDQVASLRASLSAPAPTAVTPANSGVVNPANLGEDEPVQAGATTVAEDAATVSEQVVGPIGGGADSGDGSGAAASGGEVADNSSESPSGGLAALLPTPTPLFTPTATPDGAVEAPTSTPVPPTPTQVPVEPTPTEEPSPTPEPIIAAAICTDPNSAITSPGVGQVVNGVVGVLGTANNPAFQYYKLEYALGANAGGGFVYFAGQNTPVVGGLLGNFNSTALPNGDYTLQIVVVDQTGNFAPPCQVSINVQN